MILKQGKERISQMSNYSETLSRYKKIDPLDRNALQAELDFFLDLAERANWDVDDATIAYMNKLQSAVRSLS
jgi:hypothetical protein